MCTVDKMLIKGLRSFSPDNMNVIEFYHPLTLIVGSNGAGKTTVIECLKQACTGELPPNTRSGQSFVHDPKVAGESEVKAQIKLRFRTSTGQPVVVVRSFQLTQKKASLQFKALDQTLQTYNRDTGQKEALSYRCADIDRIVPSLMGVSKAILENVIFVHQEDSNWPLAEGQVLKRKFDDIFAATKYTKALEALRKLRIEKAGDVKGFKLKLDHLATIRNTAAGLRRDRDEGQAAADKLQGAIQQLEEGMQAHCRQLEALDQKLGGMMDQQEKLSKLETERGLLAQANGDMYKRLVSAYGTDDADMPLEEVEEMVREAGPRRDAQEAELATKERQLAGERQRLEAVKEQYTREVKSQGRLVAEAEAHTRNVQDRDGFVRKLAAQEGMTLQGTPGSGPLPEATVRAFHAAWAEALAARQRQLQDAKSTARQEEEAKGAEIDAAVRQMAASREAIRSGQQQMQRNEERLNALQRQIEGCTVSTAMLDDAESRTREAEARVASRRKQLQDSGTDEQVADCNTKLEELRKRMSALRKERDRLALADESSTRLRMRQQELSTKKEQLEVLVGMRRDKVAALLGVPVGDLPAPDRWREAMDSALASKKRELESRNAALSDASSACAGRKGVLDSLQQQLRGLAGEATGLERSLASSMEQACGPGTSSRPLSELTSQTEADRGTYQQNLQRVNALDISLKHHKRHAVDRCECPTCGRPLQGQQEVEAFVRKQDIDAASIPATKASVEVLLQGIDQRLAALRALQPQFLRHQALVETEMPALRSRVEELSSELAKATEEQEELRSEVALLGHEVEEGAKLMQEVGWPLDRLARDVREKEAEVQQLQTSAAGIAQDRSVSDVDSDLEAAEGDRAHAERAKEQALRKKERINEEVAAAVSAAHKAREEASSMRALAERRTSLMDQVRSLQQAQTELEAQQQVQQAQARPLQQQIDRLTRERDALRAESHAAEAERESSLRGLTSLGDQLASRQHAVDEYERMGGKQELQRVTASLQGLQQRQQAAEALIRDLAEQRERLDATRRDADAVHRQLTDLMAYQQARRREQQLERQVDELQAAIRQVGDAAQLQLDRNQVLAKVQAMRREQDMKRGSLETVQANVMRAKQGLQQPEYATIDERYRKQLIELRTTEMANSDLEKYHKALEKALLAFHTTKMSDINKIIKEMWQKTYRNSDIDYIQIKADADAQRSYNYRVVMYSGGAELDMRGRCSAGQKVLACLIIRLALAETFCLNCGILALDEPTTNLDAANSGSLAEALRNIMVARKGQENFQLIVITHDEKFATMIGTREHADYMWRITKDENSHSLISQEPIMG